METLLIYSIGWEKNAKLDMLDLLLFEMLSIENSTVTFVFGS